jgi:hypothetical protein
MQFLPVLCSFDPVRMKYYQSCVLRHLRPLLICDVLTVMLVLMLIIIRASSSVICMREFILQFLHVLTCMGHLQKAHIKKKCF